ncbi:drug transporter [Trichoderma arundinaceum]|uniref:Drug transporter n=1 Tax=Trichoderma arundinaceum TaxID=490622 RepID=A0A395NT97_TRIAR|nr:drug transporter [Trichoderma arundinaceum]
MAARTLSSGTKQVPYMPMTVQAIPCPAPVLQGDFDSCRIPGGIELWSNGGFYSPGECFVGYRAMCTQASAVSNGWPILKGETVVRCIPIGYDCNDMTKDQRFAITNYDGTTLSAPAFEIRWRSVDLTVRTTERFPPGIPTPMPTSTNAISTSREITTTERFVTTLASSLLISSTINQFSSSGVSSPPPLRSTPALSPGAVAGITLGSCLGLLAVASAIAFLLLHRRRKHRGPRRLIDDSWCQQGTRKESAGMSVAQCPAELENKPMELRELPVETHPQAANTSHMSRACHISVNSVPIEVAADPAQTKTEAAERGN